MSAFSGDEWVALPSRRRSSLRRRFVVAITILVAIEIAALTLVLGLSSRRRLRTEIETGARNYAALAVGPVCKAYETYYESGHRKFRQIIGDIAARNPDLDRMAIYDTSGRLLFSTDDLADPVAAPQSEPGPVSSDPRLLEAVRGLRPVEWSAPGGARFYVIEPHIEEWGRHRYSVLFEASYAGVGAASRQLHSRLILPAVVSLILGVVLAFLLARQSLEPLEKLIAGARDIGRGRLDRRIEVHSDDEFEDLAATFNRMASHLSSNIVELEENNVALQQSNVELQELDRLKSDLLANVSHELRTPLTSVKGYAEAMSDELLGPINEEQREALEVSRRNIDRLLGMIGGLLGYSRAASGRLPMRRETIDLAVLARDVVEAVLSARGTETDLVVVEGAGPFLADADAASIGQVLENLTTNAVKFTPKGGRVEVRLEVESEMVRVEVVDEGIGIDPALTSRIFDRFYQVESSSTRRFGGIGLGLALVKQILDAHGCGIEVESEVGVGTTFRFRLPRPADQLRSEAALIKIFIVDPDAAFARELGSQAEQRGWGWRVVPSAAAARRLMDREHPDAVILDRLLPDGDGFGLLEEWRHGDPSLLIVVVSERRDEAVARRLGASTYLLKPIDAALVFEELEACLSPASSRLGLVVAEELDGVVRAWIRRLRDQGISCRRVRSGAEVSELLEGRPPTLVLLDGRAGFRVGWQELLPVVAAASIPVVLMASGSQGAVLLERLAALGVTLSHRVDSEEELLRVASMIG